MISLSFVDLTINFFCITCTYWIVKKILLNRLYNVIKEINKIKAYNDKIYREKRDMLLEKKRVHEESLEKIEVSLKKNILNVNTDSLTQETFINKDNAISHGKNNFLLQKKEIQNIAEALYSKTFNVKHMIRN